MKKLVSTIMLIAIAISLVGCGKNGYVNSAENHNYFTAFNLAYGMSVKDCENALKNNEIITITKDTYTLLQFKSVFHKMPVDVALFIEKDGTAPVDIGLYRIVVEFQKKINYKEALQKTFEYIDAEKLPYESSSVEYSTADSSEPTANIFKNTNSLNTIADKSLKEETIAYSSKLYSAKGDSTIDDIANFPIETITLHSKDLENLTEITFVSKTAGLIGIAENKK